jgi:hypothetical protein
MFHVLKSIQNEDLMGAIHLAFKLLVPKLPKDYLITLDSFLKSLLTSKDGYVRETTLKLIRLFPSEVIELCSDALLEAAKDVIPTCRRQALRNIELLLKFTKKRVSNTEFETIALSYMPVLAECLKDSNPQVVVQALKVINVFKMKTFEEVSYDCNLDELQDQFYEKKIIEPHLKTLTQLLTSRKFNFNKEIRIELFTVLGETEHLLGHMSSYKQILNSDQVSTLVEFAEAIQTLGPQVLQYIPHLIVNIRQSTSPLVRHLVRLIQKFIKTMTTQTCDKLFGVHTVANMLKNKDAAVRRAAVQLMGKKCTSAPGNLWLLTRMWGDKNAKVKKEVMEVLGDFGKVRRDHITMILESSFLEDFNSIIVWRNLSYAWQTLTVKVLAEESHEDSASRSDDQENKSSNDSSDSSD